jgi:hypothetical protein
MYLYQQRNLDGRNISVKKNFVGTVIKQRLFTEVRLNYHFWLKEAEVYIMAEII